MTTDLPEPLFQFRLRTLFAWTVLLAIACAAFVTGEKGWLTLIVLMIAIALGGSLVAATVAQGSARAFYVSFVVFSVLSLLLSYRVLRPLEFETTIPTGEWFVRFARELHPSTVSNSATSAAAQRATSAGIKSVAVFTDAFAAYVFRAIYVVKTLNEPRRIGHSPHELKF